MRLLNYLNGIEGVAVGGVATVNVPTGRRYHMLKPFVTSTVGGGTTNPITILDYVRMLVNGVLMRDLTPTQVIAISNFNNITPAASELPVYLSEPWRATIIGEEATSWDLHAQAKCTMELKFKATATAPTCVVLASFDYGQNIVGEGAAARNFLSIIKQQAYTYNVGAIADLTTLNVKYPIQRIHIQTDAGTVTSVQVMRDSEIVYDVTTAQNSAFLKDYDIDASQFSFSVAFDHTQQATDALTGLHFESNPISGIKDLNVHVVSAGAAVLTVLPEVRANGFV